MSEQQAGNLGNTIRQARTDRKLSTRQLAELAGTSKAMIVRIEMGDQRSPKPKVLEHIATVLGLPLSDLYALAGYKTSESLPALPPYIYARYGYLPEEARTELQKDFERIVKRYGYDPAGPAPGEDEN